MWLAEFARAQDEEDSGFLLAEACLSLDSSSLCLALSTPLSWFPPLLTPLLATIGFWLFFYSRSFQILAAQFGLKM